MGFLSFICTFGPFVIFSIIGFIEAEVVYKKLVLTLTLIGAIIISFIAVLQKVQLRSIPYIIMIGLWVVLDRLLPFIIVIAICTIFDELIFSPLYKRYNEDYHTNLQIDKRDEVKDE
jgi:hypothetical protein